MIGSHTVLTFGHDLPAYVAIHSGCLLAIGVLACLSVWLRYRDRIHSEECRREHRIREELEAYAKLEPDFTPPAPGKEPGELTRSPAKAVCRVIADKSAFSQIAMLLRDIDGKLYCAASAGVDDLTVAALHKWGEHIVDEERETRVVRSLTTGAGLALGSVRVSPRSFALQLGQWQHFDAEVSSWKLEGRRERRNFRRAIATPMHNRGGRLSGVLVVCGEMSAENRPMGLERALVPIEMLAAKLATAMDATAMSERLLRAEKLAGLGQLAGGVAHALNNPLTAVLGFAELIAQSSNEFRVRKDANTIVLEALKMRDTVQRLVEFWRPVSLGDEAVEVGPMLQELAGRCSSKLEHRGVRLIVSAADEVPPVRGSRDRLRQVLEHLLNNAAQAIATAKAPVNGEDHTIRLTLSCDPQSVHVVVSDTGPGFAEPSRVFDPFYTTQQVGEGSGLGLSICYSIVREHGGEISAFNLHPHGAAVVVELPIRKIVQGVDESHVLLYENAQAS